MTKKFQKIVTTILIVSAIVLSMISLGLSGIISYQAYMDVRIVNQKINRIENSLVSVKPTYEYLCSVTVPIVGKRGEEKWMGTGVIIKITDDYTYILTNNHVAPSTADTILVLVDNGIEAEAVKNDGILADLALVRVPGKLANRQEVNGFSIGSPQDNIYSVGMYLGLPYIYTEGTFAGYQEGDVLVNMPSLFGCSGSGIFDKEGNLIALLYAGNAYSMFGTDTAKAICVPIEQIMRFIDELTNEK